MKTFLLAIVCMQLVLVASDTKKPKFCKSYEAELKKMFTSVNAMSTTGVTCKNIAPIAASVSGITNALTSLGNGLAATKTELLSKLDGLAMGDISCRIDIRASAFDDAKVFLGGKSRGNGHLMLNGRKVTDDKGRGITLVTVTPRCTIGEITVYDTWGDSKAGDALRTHLLGLSPDILVAGISDDAYMAKIGKAKDVLSKQYGVDFTGSGYRTSLAWVMRKGSPARTVQAVKPRFKGPALLSVTVQTCRIEISASGFDDAKVVPHNTGTGKWRGDGFVKINGKKVTNDGGRGVTLVTLTSQCEVGKITNYDTWGVSSSGGKLRDYLSGLPRDTLLVGLTDDAYVRYLAPAKPVLQQLGVDLSDSAFRTSLGFVTRTGEPFNTAQATKPRYQGPAKLSVSVTGF